MEYNFEKVDFVGEPGQFALRGGIIDMFSYSSDKPYRIDFFGNEVESIREFDTNTQRSLRELDEVEIFPNIYHQDQFQDQECVDIFEFVGNNKCTVWVNDITALQGEQYSGVLENIKKNRIISFNDLEDKDTVNIEYRISPQPSFNKNFQLLLQDINQKIKEGYTIFISSENERQFDRLRNIFAHNSEESTLKAPKFIELNCSLHTGFVDTITKNCLYFRSKDQTIADHHIKQGFYTHAIPCQKQTLLFALPNSKGKYTI